MSQNLQICGFGAEIFFLEIDFGAYILPEIFMPEQTFLFPELAPPRKPPKSTLWNLWHGCTKHSEGCLNCYVFRNDFKHGLDSTTIYKTRNFSLPVSRNKSGEYLFPPQSFFYTCFTSDFLHPKCDEWRRDAWEIMRERSDCHFLFLTKRIERFADCLPPDWGDGYDNVTVGSTCESQRQVDFRLPIFKRCPAKHKIIVHEPILTALDISAYLDREIEEVIAGGESGPRARPCRYEWFVSLREQCERAGVKFGFKQTGAVFVKDGKTYHIERPLQHIQAKKAGLDFQPKNRI
ncbi:MAG: phage Gp37/Gp68 family protein [Puniceicoccales bacterium]|nr:phage Gp37/Gp68 family protein [Puniceicoccales bacterium]